MSVVHVANDPVQNIIPIKGFSIDVNLFYPNPFFKEAFYQPGEYFNFFITLDKVTFETLTRIDQMNLSWTRVAPVLPWMNMSGGFNSTLVFSAQRSEVDCLNQMDVVLFNEIAERNSSYQHTRTCQLNTLSETIWTYFKKYFAEYLPRE